MNQLVCQLGQIFVFPVREAPLYCEVLPFGVTKFAHSLNEGIVIGIGICPSGTRTSSQAMSSLAPVVEKGESTEAWPPFGMSATSSQDLQIFSTAPECNCGCRNRSWPAVTRPSAMAGVARESRSKSPANGTAATAAL